MYALRLIRGRLLDTIRVRTTITENQKTVVSLTWGTNDRLCKAQYPVEMTLKYIQRSDYISKGCETELTRREETYTGVLEILPLDNSSASTTLFWQMLFGK